MTIALSTKTAMLTVTFTINSDNSW